MIARSTFFNMLAAAVVTLGTFSAQAQSGQAPGRHLTAIGRPAPQASHTLHAIRRTTAHGPRIAQPFTMPHHAKPMADQSPNPEGQRGGAPANNNCSGAVMLTVGTSCDPVSGTVDQATQSIVAVTCATFMGNANDDVWYSFVANAADVTIFLECNADFDGVIDLRSGSCNGTNLDCMDNFIAGGSETLNATGLSIGTTYYVRVYDYEAGYPLDPTFNICVYGTPPAPPNDECDNAEIQDLSVPGSATVTGDNTGATDTEGIGLNSVWEAFTITECADVTIDYCGTDPAFGQYFIALVDDCVFTTIYDTTSTGECADGNVSMVFSGLQAGTYHYPVAQSDVATGAYTITFTAVACGSVTTPPNDECDNAVIQDLSVPGFVTVTGDNTGATDSEGIGFNTVWEAFTITECADVTVDYCGTDPAFGQWFIALVDDCALTIIYDTTSTGLCGDDNVTITFGGLQAGTYHYPVLQSDVATGAYTINFTAVPCGVGGDYDDECSDATPSLLTTGQTVTFTGDNTGCTDTEGLGFDNAWVAFTTTECMDITWDFCGSTDAMLVYTNLFTGCPWQSFSSNCGTAPDAECGDLTTSPLVSAMQVPPGTYYIVIPYVDVYGGIYQINVSGTPCSAPVPVNDECTGAISLTAGSTCVPVSGTTEGATRSLPDLECNGFTGLADDDVWYSFVATTPGGSIYVTATDSLDAVVQLYSGLCGGFTPLNCADATLAGEEEELVYSGLTVGETYYYRVHGYGLGVFCDGFFTTCVVEDVSTGIGSVAPNTLVVRPNPSEGVISITWTGNTGAAIVEILDMSGRLIWSQNGNLLQGRTIDVPVELAAGTYAVRVSTNEGRSEQRVMVR